MTDAATLANLLEQMKRNQDVLNGWDVVFNLLEDPVNDILRVRFTDTAPATWKTISKWYCQLVPNPTGPGELVVYTKLAVTLENPALQFVAASARASVTFDAVGSVAVAAKAAPAGFAPSDCDANDPSLKWTVTPLDSATLTGDVPLTVLVGTSTTSQSGFRTVLDLPAGSFTLSGTGKAITDTSKLSNEVQAYFEANSVQYILNEVSTNVAGQVPELTPTAFKLNTLITNAGKRLLQLFVTTTGTEQTNLTIDVNEPIPSGSGATLMVSRAIAQQLGSGGVNQSSTFALKNLIFPGAQLLVLQGNYEPYDLLVVGDFQPNATLAIRSGNDQSVARSGTSPTGGQAAFGPLSLMITDPFGHAAEGVEIQFTVADAPPLLAVVFPDGAATTITRTSGADGMVSVDDGNGQSVVCYYAQGPFSIVATGPGGARAVFDLTVAPTPPPPSRKGYTVTVAAGNSQSAPRKGTNPQPDGTATYAPLSVVVRDENGNLAPGVQVEWKPGSHPPNMAVQVTPSGAPPALTTTDANGVATLAEMSGSSVSCYYDQGAFEVIASVHEGGSATFDLTVAPPPPPASLQGYTVAVLGGDDQSVPRTGTNAGGTATFAPLSVSVKDSHGQLAPGVLVEWASHSPPAMAAQLGPSGTSSVKVASDASGVSTLAEMPGGASVLCYYAQGPFTVTAGLHGGGSTTFNLTVAASAAPPSYPGAMVKIVSGDGQTEPRKPEPGIDGGTASFAPLVVLIRDKNGNAMAGVDVEFTPSRNNGGPYGEVDPSGVSPGVVKTDANGVATLNKLPGGYGVQFYYGTGPWTVTASVRGGGSAVIHGTVSS